MAERKSAARAAAELDAETQRERADGWMARAQAAERERDTLAAEVRRLRALHSPETAEVEDVNGISTATYCGHDGHPWPCPSIGDQS